MGGGVCASKASSGRQWRKSKEHTKTYQQHNSQKLVYLNSKALRSGPIQIYVKGCLLFRFSLRGLTVFAPEFRTDIDNWTRRVTLATADTLSRFITESRDSRTRSQRVRGCDSRCSLRCRPVVTDVPPARAARAATCAPSVGDSRKHLISAYHTSLPSTRTTIENNLHQPLSL